MRFSQFLGLRFPVHEIISAHYRRLMRLQNAGEQAGVLVRHGFEGRWKSPVPDYYGDESYPSSRPGNVDSISQDFLELYVVNNRSDDPRVTALPKGVYPHLFPWRLAFARPRRQKRLQKSDKGWPRHRARGFPP